MLVELSVAGPMTRVSTPWRWLPSENSTRPAFQARRAAARSSSSQDSSLVADTSSSPTTSPSSRCRRPSTRVDVLSDQVCQGAQTSPPPNGIGALPVPSRSPRFVVVHRPASTPGSSSPGSRSSVPTVRAAVAAPDLGVEGPAAAVGACGAVSNLASMAPRLPHPRVKPTAPHRDSQGRYESNNPSEERSGWRDDGAMASPNTDTTLAEGAALLAAIADTPPGAPTACAAWSAHDLVA